MIKEGQSAVSRAAHERHIQEYSALVQQLQTRFGIELGKLDDDDSDSSETEGDDTVVQKEGGSTRHRNNNAEEQKLGAAMPLQQRRLETDFEAIDAEVKQSISGTLRDKENEASRPISVYASGVSVMKGCVAPYWLQLPCYRKFSRLSKLPRDFLLPVDD